MRESEAELARALGSRCDRCCPFALRDTLSVDGRKFEF